MARNGEISRVRARDPDIDYVVPGEGSLLLQYCLCIPRRVSTPTKRMRSSTICRSASRCEIPRTLRYATPITAARAALPEGAQRSRTYPDDQIIARSEIINYRGERVISRYEKACQSINAKA
jgi:spermidine/putrescine-binding protein